MSETLAINSNARRGMSLKSWLFLFSCNLMWALQFTCIKLVENQVGALFTVWGPMTLATLLLYHIVSLERRRSEGESDEKPKRQKSDVWVFLLLALVGIFPGQVIITWG